MKKLKKLIIPIVIVLILIIGVVLFLIMSPKKFTLKENKDNKLSVNLRGNKEEEIILKVDNDNLNIVLSDFNNKNNSNYIIYLLKDNKGKIINRGLIHNDRDTIIPKVKSGDYTLNIIYKNKNDFKLEGNISLKSIKEEKYSTLISGYEINKKIKSYVGADYKDETLKNVKIASKIDDKYKSNEYIVSTSESGKPIYMWIENDTIYFYSENKIDLGKTPTYMFSRLYALTDVSDLKEFRADDVEDINNMFDYNENLSDIKFISYFNMPKLKNAGYLFGHCISLVDITPLVSLNTDNLESIDSILTETSVSDISIFKYFDTKKIKSMYGMLNGTKVSDLSPIKDWNTSNVTKLSYAFSATKIKDVDALSNWDVSKVDSMYSIFGYCVELNNIDGLKNWNTKNVTDLTGAFRYTELVNVNGLSKWNTKNVTKMKKIFERSRKLKDISGISNWNTSNVLDLEEAFCYTGITNVDSLSKWDVSNVTNMKYSFSHTKIKNLKGIKNWDTSKVNDFSYTFDHLLEIENVNDIDNWNISSGTNFEGTFYKTGKTPKWSGSFDENGTYVK